MGAALMMGGAERAAASDGDCDTLLAPLLQSGRVYGLHALLVASGGRLLFERYWDGEDWKLDVPLGRIAYGLSVPHDLRSVSKSIVGMVYGIALAEDPAGEVVRIPLAIRHRPGSALHLPTDPSLADRAPRCFSLPTLAPCLLGPTIAACGRSAA
jgi:hypothetical protein